MSDIILKIVKNLVKQIDHLHEKVSYIFELFYKQNNKDVKINMIIFVQMLLFTYR